MSIVLENDFKEKDAVNAALGLDANSVLGVHFQEALKEQGIHIVAKKPDSQRLSMVPIMPILDAALAAVLEDAQAQPASDLAALESIINCDGFVNLLEQQGYTLSI